MVTDMHVLVAESRTDSAERLAGAARRQGYVVQMAQTGREALLKYQHVDIVLLGLGLPDIDGVEVCRSIRDAGETPVICISDEDNAVERVLALKSGADDCVLESCGEREIMARIEAVMRRTQCPEPSSQSITLPPLHLDARAREVRIRGERVDVTSKEFDLLYTLAATPETVLSRKELMSRVWHDEWGSGSRTIDTHVSSLRSKLKAPRLIITIRGVGYRLGVLT
ncbi:MAG TPA: response regulator transcription factor [Actinocrinis sp.]|nr:response regulator transcription factor [Actinocrinis sp.]